MKKLMFALGTAAALVGMADIESVNTVGFTQTEAPQGQFLILGSGFQEVGGSFDVNGLVSGVQGVDYDDEGAFKSTAAQIQVPKASGGYTVIYYLNDGWFDDDGKDGYKAGWCDSNGVIVDTEMTPGVAFWFKSVPSNASAVVAGEVPTEDEMSVNCPEDFALRSNPFPVAVSVNGQKLVAENIAGKDYDDAGAFKTNAPQIQIMKATGGYTVLYYLNDGWFDDNGSDGYKAGWCDSNGVIVDAEVAAGQGFWTKGVTGAFSIKFTK